MNLYIKILRGIFFILFVFILLFILYNGVYISYYLGIPLWSVYTFVSICVLAIGIHHIFLLLKIGELEFEFTSIVNHVFRTPLTRIMWITKELEKDLLPEEKKIYLQNLENATSRIIDIVDIIAGIKDVKNKEGYFFQAVYIREIVEKSLIKYRENIAKKNINFNLSNFKDLPMLTVDLKKISFVIDVLIENAILYTSNNGMVEIWPEVRNNKMLIMIKDSGIGLNMKDKMKIFSKFYRGKEAKLMYTDGMGLGLYLSKIIVKRHGGRIYAKSDGRNLGSTFFVELPFSR